MAIQLNIRIFKLLTDISLMFIEYQAQEVKLSKKRFVQNKKQIKINLENQYYWFMDYFQVLLGLLLMEMEMKEVSLLKQ
jgi:uncharacterized protein YcfL